MSRGGKAFLYLLYAVIVGVLAVAIIDASRTHPSTPVPTVHTSKPQQATAPPKKPSPPSTKKSTALSAGQAATATGNTAGLSNTGPGNVVGLFVVVSLGGAVVYRQLVIRRLKTD
jgi:hypothetical protein